MQNFGGIALSKLTMQVGRFIHRSTNSNVDGEGLLIRTQVIQPKMNDSSVPGNERF